MRLSYFFVLFVSAGLSLTVQAAGPNSKVAEDYARKVFIPAMGENGWTVNAYENFMRVVPQSSVCGTLLSWVAGDSSVGIVVDFADPNSPKFGLGSENSGAIWDAAETIGIGIGMGIRLGLAGISLGVHTMIIPKLPDGSPTYETVKTHEVFVQNEIIDFHGRLKQSVAYFLKGDIEDAKSVLSAPNYCGKNGDARFNLDAGIPAGSSYRWAAPPQDMREDQVGDSPINLNPPFSIAQ